MWKLTASDLGSSYTYRSLKNARIETVNDILHAAGVTWQDFLDLSAQEVVEQFCDHCEGLTRFGDKSRYTLKVFLKKNRRRILQEQFEDAYTQSDADVQEDDDYVPDLGNIIPVETLLIDVVIVKGGVNHVCIEDVISQFESDIMESDIELEDSEMKSTVLEAIEITEWPADRPIYVSRYDAKVYPEIVVALTRSAVLVLK